MKTASPCGSSERFSLKFPCGRSFLLDAFPPVTYTLNALLISQNPRRRFTYRLQALSIISLADYSCVETENNLIFPCVFIIILRRLFLCFSRNTQIETPHGFCFFSAAACASSRLNFNSKFANFFLLSSCFSFNFYLIFPSRLFLCFNWPAPSTA